MSQVLPAARDAVRFGAQVAVVMLAVLGGACAAVVVLGAV